MCAHVCIGGKGGAMELELPVILRMHVYYTILKFHNSSLAPPELAILAPPLYI